MAHAWTDDQTERLIALSTTPPQKSAQTIAQILSQEWCQHVSRNSVVGKVNRLQKQGRLAKGRKNVTTPRAPRAQIKKPKTIPRSYVINRVRINRTETPKKPLVMEKGILTIDDLTNATCKWPFGENPPYHYCGDHTVEGTPYCLEHCRMSYTPASQNRVQTKPRYR